MKKLMIIAVVGAAGLVSCKKDYVCSCTYVSTQQYYLGGSPYGSPSTSTTSDTRVITDKEDVATAECTGGNGTITQTSSQSGFTVEQSVTTSCSIAKQ